MSLESPILADRVLCPRAERNFELPSAKEFKAWSKRQKKLFIYSRMARLGLYTRANNIIDNYYDDLSETYQQFLNIAQLPGNESLKKHFCVLLTGDYEEEILGYAADGISLEEILLDINSEHGVYGFRTIMEADPRYEGYKDAKRKMFVMEETTFRQYCAMAYKEGQKHAGQCATGESAVTLDPISFFEPLYKDNKGMQSTEHLTSKILAKMGLHKIPFYEFMPLLEVNLQRGREGKPAPVYGSSKKAKTDKSL